MVSLWNDMRLAAKKPPMGFINPFLYSTYKIDPSAFNDIIQGDNVIIYIYIYNVYIYIYTLYTICIIEFVLYASFIMI